ncbi:hypothetical protein BDV23DRAFT_182847 [Aspergillus alliaceus]|uniref:Beta-ketoacyl synthase-like N-terminal domain-containing protein n=1 Tax=Petromyces alliaceus TaxID=209559 RepID=A0A5N7CAG2_PETAA|nr:hypothetical protein BDV23DRAFT_182847 [Aspergillus alliaceus]
MGSIEVQPIVRNGLCLENHQLARSRTESQKGSNSQSGEAGDAEPTVQPIAIVGMAVRLPGNVRSPDELWDLLFSQKDVSREVPKDRHNVDAFHSTSNSGTVKTRRGFFLEGDLADMDRSAFNVGQSEA